jgi:GMP synthase-like glutamine amidotransferase
MHIESEGPGRFGEYFAARGDELSVVRLYEGDALPDSPAGLDLVISLGGPMNVYEDEAYPFLADETEFLRRAMAAGTVVIGVCLGAQLIARAAGASVYRAPVKEVGWMNVSLTEKGAEDPLFGGLPSPLPVLQWHGDTFDIPPGGEHLAASADCPHQAFRAGSAWGLQFHLEATPAMIARWFDGEKEFREIVDRTAQLEPEVSRNWRRFSNNLSRLLEPGAVDRKGVKD